MLYDANEVSNNKDNDKENAVGKGNQTQFLIMLFYFGECAHVAAHVNTTVSEFFI